MPDDYDDRFRRHEEIMEGLARMLAAQHEMNRNSGGRDAIRNSAEINQRLTLAIERTTGP